MNTSSRSVRVFLSSTFRDFAEERDLLVSNIFSKPKAGKLECCACELGVLPIFASLTHWAVSSLCPGIRLSNSTN
jgi:hypothetical protein